MPVRIQVDVTKATAGLDNLRAKQIPFALAQALTATAQEIKTAEVAEMRRAFDRPTPYTLGSLYVRSATYKPGGWQPRNTTGTRFKSEYLTAYVGVSDLSAGKGVAAVNFVSPNVYGGGRNLKRFERALQAKGLLPQGYYCVPGKNVPLDQYGNVPRALIVRMLSQLQSFGESGYKANETEKSRKRRLRSETRANYFVISKARGSLPAGVWQRIGRQVSLVFMFVHAPQYRKRFKFFDVAIRVAQQRFDHIFAGCLSNALRTAR